MIISPLGIILNLLTISIFVKLKTHKTSTGLHLVCLAFSEALLLLGFGMSRLWVQKISNLHVSYCIFKNFLSASQQIWSGLLLVAMTIERYISIAFLLKVKSWNLKRISKILISIFAILSCLLGGMSAARRVVDRRRVPNICGNNPNLMELSEISNTLIYTILGFGLCPILTFIFTVLIAYQLFKQKRARNAMVQDDQSNNNSNSKEFTITLMLFLVASLFLVSKFVQVTVWYIRNYSYRDSILFQHAAIAFNFARLLVIINHSANSVIYIIFFENFRKALLALLCCRSQSMEETQRDNNGNREQTSMTDVSQVVSRATCVDEQWLSNSYSVFCFSPLFCHLMKHNAHFVLACWEQWPFGEMFLLQQVDHCTGITSCLFQLRTVKKLVVVRKEGGTVWLVLFCQPRDQ